MLLDTQGHGSRAASWQVASLEHAPFGSASMPYSPEDSMGAAGVHAAGVLLSTTPPASVDVSEAPESLEGVLAVLDDVELHAVVASDTANTRAKRRKGLLRNMATTSCSARRERAAILGGEVLEVQQQARRISTPRPDAVIAMNWRTGSLAEEVDHDTDAWFGSGLTHWQ